MKKYTVIAFLIIISVIFCSCSVQKSSDIYGFSSRLFKLLDRELYEPSGYFYDGNSRYSYFLSTADTRTAVLTLSTNEDLSVKSFEITLTKDDLPITDAGQSEIYKLFACACSVLTQKSIEELCRVFSENGFTEKTADFLNNNLSFETEEMRIFVFSNSEIISFYTEII